MTLADKLRDPLGGRGVIQNQVGVLLLDALVGLLSPAPTVLRGVFVGKACHLPALPVSLKIWLTEPAAPAAGKHWAHNGSASEREMGIRKQRLQRKAQL